MSPVAQPHTPDHGDDYLSGRIDFDEALARTLDVSVDRVREMLAASLSRIETITEEPNPPLPTAEQQALDAAGLTEDPGAAATTMTGTLAEVTAVTGTALTAKEAGARIGLTDSRVRQLIRQRRLWAYTPGDGGARLLPAAQFTDSAVVPHLSRVLPAVPTDLHPVAFHRLLTVAQPDLRLDGAPVSLVDWVAASNGDADRLDQAIAIVHQAAWAAV